MNIVDDPMLALIARFVVEDIDDPSISDEAFLQQQIEEIRSHVGRAPTEKRQQLALAWIIEHAEQYRRDWQRRTFSKLALAKRCADCPILQTESGSFCAIHSRWVALLKAYVAHGISSDQYVKETLELLNQHKTNLKISTISPNLQP